jgi:hypothetical protein
VFFSAKIRESSSTTPPVSAVSKFFVKDDVALLNEKDKLLRVDVKDRLKEEIKQNVR